MLADLPLSQLRRYVPDVAEPADFEEFWAGQLAAARAAAGTPEFTAAGTAPSTVFAAFNHYAGPKQIAVYEFNGHEGGGTRHLQAKLDFLAATLSEGTP